MRWLIVIALCVLAGGWTHGIPGGTPKLFTPLHLYFLSTTGSDSNSGLDAAHPWATPNHAVVCGDVIIAAPGNYTNTSNAFDAFGTVSSCPSTSGGIDGTGGIYFATFLCGGSDLEACQVSAIAFNGDPVFTLRTNNWAVEGFKCTGSGTARCFEGQTCSGPTVHHVAFINDISYDALQGYDTNDCGQPGSTPGSTPGVDYFAVVGSVAQNSAQDGICLAAVDVVGPGVFDTRTDTHYYVRDTFSYSNNNNPFCSVYAAPSVSFTPGGALGATTYFVQYVYTAAGCTMTGQDCRTSASVETSIAVPANNLLIVTSPPALTNAGITGWQAYVSTTSGSEQCQNGTGGATGTCIFGTGNIAVGTNWTEPTSGLITTIGTGCSLPSTCRFDTESFLADTWDFHHVGSWATGVYDNNIGFGSDRMCINMFWQNNDTGSPIIKVHNLTCFHNLERNGGDNYDGEIYISVGVVNSTVPWNITVQNNIAYQPNANSLGGVGGISAFGLTSAITNFTHGGTGSENVYKANNSSCQVSFCNSGNDIGVIAPGTAANLGTNFYQNPSFANTTDLLANQSGVPNCTGKQTVTQCMGYDPNSHVLTTLSIIGDLQASCAGCAGKGYQLPSTICAPNPDYPIWLKGVVVLRKNQVDGKIYEYPDLVTKPCNL